jgi:hypothetical protein
MALAETSVIAGQKQADHTGHRDCEIMAHNNCWSQRLTVFLHAMTIRLLQTLNG